MSAIIDFKRNEMADDLDFFFGSWVVYDYKNHHSILIITNSNTVRTDFASKLEDYRRVGTLFHIRRQTFIESWLIRLGFIKEYSFIEVTK